MCLMMVTTAWTNKIQNKNFTYIEQAKEVRKTQSPKKGLAGKMLTM